MGVRLTRRGRLVVLVFFLLLAGLAVAVVAPASEAADPPGGGPVAVVQPGDTLWAIAERHLPDRDPISAVEDIRRLNRLTGSTIHAGQRLELPRRR